MSHAAAQSDADAYIGKQLFPPYLRSPLTLSTSAQETIAKAYKEASTSDTPERELSAL